MCVSRREHRRTQVDQSISDAAVAGGEAPVDGEGAEIGALENGVRVPGDLRRALLRLRLRQFVQTSQRQFRTLYVLPHRRDSLLARLERRLLYET